MLLWKAADYLGPLDVSVSEYGGENMGSVVLVSIKPSVAVIVCNSAAPTTASAQPALCAETHSSRKMTRRGMQNSTITTMGMT